MKTFAKILIIPASLLVLWGAEGHHFTIAWMTDREAGDQAASSHAAAKFTTSTTAAQFPNLAEIGIDGSQFWVKRPDPLPLLKAPHEASGKVWIRRTIPSDLSKILPIAPIRARLVADKMPHRLALVSLLEHNDALMQQAKDQYFALGAKAYEYGQGGLINPLALGFALDLIRWDSEAQFEQAFEIARLTTVRNMISESPVAYNNDFWNINHRAARILLAMVAQGRPGPSGTWADQVLVGLSAPVSDDDGYTNDPYLICNILSLMGVEGNEGFGRAQGGGNGMGMYTSYYAAMVPILWAWDNATNAAPGTGLIDRCYFIKAMAKHNIVNERTPIHNLTSPDIHYLYLVSDDPQAAWYWKNNPYYAGLSHQLFFRALMNKGITPQPPTEKLVEANSQINYADNPADPNSFWFHAPFIRLDHGRWPPDEGQFEMGIGKVALLRDILSKSYTNGKTGNSWFATADFAGNRSERQAHPYWYARPILPEDVATKPIFLKKSLAAFPPPTIAADGHLRFTVDYSHAWDIITGGSNDDTIIGKVKKAVTNYDLDPVNKILIVEHTVQADTSLYFGYHFSPTQASIVDNPNQFHFGDGINSITVTLQPLDGTTLNRVIAPAYNWDGSPPMKRCAENVGYVPSQRLTEHKVRITVKAN